MYVGQFITFSVFDIRELKQQRFWATDVNRKWTFCIIGRWFGWNSQVNRPYKRKETYQYKFLKVKAYSKGEDLTARWRASLKNVVSSLLYEQLFIFGLYLENIKSFIYCFFLYLFILFYLYSFIFG